MMTFRVSRNIERMEVLESVEGSPHLSDTIPDCNGTETNLISCFSPNTLTITCDYLLVECRDPVTTEPTATTANATTVTTATTDTESPTEDGSSGGVSVAVFAGVGGVIVVFIAAILIVLLLIVAILKKNKSRCMRMG